MTLLNSLRVTKEVILMNNFRTYANTSKMPNPNDSVLLACSSRPKRELVAAMLDVGGYNLVLAKNSDEALAGLSQGSPQLIILESHLLWQSGYSICAHLRETPINNLVPVIILASEGESDSRRKALEAGANDCLRWPVAMSALLAKTNSLLRAHHRYDEMVNVEKVLLALASIEDAKDPWSQGHLERVVDYATRLGQALGLDASQLWDLRRGAILHDIGKLGVSEAILSKVGPLSELDWYYIRLHPTIGENIIQPLGQDRVVKDIVRHHHERFDGRGYPDGLADKHIPLAGRIVALADTYDALTSDRPYRTKLTEQRAREVLLSEAGRQFDPELVALFIPLVQGIHRV